MGNIGVQEAMQGDLAKLTETAVEAPLKLVQLIINIRRAMSEHEKNKAITKVQKTKLDQLDVDSKQGKVSLKDLSKSGEDISKLSDLDKSCYKVLKKNLDETGIKYNVQAFKDENGDRSFSIIFEDKNASKVQMAVEKSLKQMQDPKFKKIMNERPSVMQKLNKAKAKAAEINKNNVEKHKHQEQSR